MIVSSDMLPLIGGDCSARRTQGGMDCYMWVISDK
jgi:hypothetical protein